jgi:hypothetical protein
MIGRVKLIVNLDYFFQYRDCAWQYTAACGFVQAKVVGAIIIWSHIQHPHGQLSQTIHHRPFGIR